jgi:hypothetical protein
MVPNKQGMIQSRKKRDKTHMRKYNSTINLTEMRCDGVNGIHVTHGSDKLLRTHNEPSGYIKGGEFLEEAGNFLKSSDKFAGRF